MNAMEPINLSNTKQIRDIVYDYIRKAILDGDLGPGVRIIENDFADKMSISRTPVREALRRLETEGFVQYIPRKGVVVKEFSFKDIEEIYAIRKSLEILNIRYVINNISPGEIEELTNLIKIADKANKEGDREAVFKSCQDFNELILSSGKMPRLAGMINTMQEHLTRFRKITFSAPSRLEKALEEHRKILQAIVDRDVKKAEALVCEHLDGSMTVFSEMSKAKFL